MDWQTVTARRASKAAPSEGGWNIFATTNVLPDVGSPLGFFAVAGNGANAWFGWPEVPAIEADRAKMARTADPAEFKALAADIQKEVIDQVVMIPLGEFNTITAKRKELANQLDAAVPVFWNMTKTGK
jgi:peptide/nickel transport system substrate-binding protein